MELLYKEKKGHYIEVKLAYLISAVGPFSLAVLIWIISIGEISQNIDWFLFFIVMILIILSFFGAYLYFHRKRVFLYSDHITLKGILFGKYLYKSIPYNNIHLVRVNEKGRRIQILIKDNKVRRVWGLHYKDLEEIISLLEEKETDLVFEPFF